MTYGDIGAVQQKVFVAGQVQRTSFSMFTALSLRPCQLGIGNREVRHGIGETFEGVRASVGGGLTTAVQSLLHESAI